MSKSKHKKYYDYLDEEEISYSESKEQSKNRRKQKRIKNALKTKNIDDLIRYEEEENY